MIELDRAAGGAARGRWPRRPGTSRSVWGDAMKVDLAALEPGADADGGQPAVLDRDAAAPADDRRAAVAGGVDGDGPARDRRPAAARRPARAPTAAPSRARAARLRGRAAARRSTRPCSRRARGWTRRCSGSSGLARARPRRSSALVRGAFAHRRKTLAGSLELAGVAARDAVRAALEAAGLDPAARAEALAPGGLRPPRRAVGFPERDAARARQAQPLPATGACARRTGCTSCARCSARSPLADRIVITELEGEADEVVCPGVEGPNLVAAALGGAARARAGTAPPVRVEIDKRIPVAAGLGGGSADAAAVLRHLAPERDDLPEIAAGAREPTCPSQLGPGCRWSGAPARWSSRCRRRASSPSSWSRSSRGWPRRGVRGGGPAGRSGAMQAGARGCEGALREAASAGASPLDYPELLVNDLQGAALSLRPEIDEALVALEEAGAARGAGDAGRGRPRSGCSPTSSPPTGRPRRCRRGSPGRSSAHRRGSCRRVSGLVRLPPTKQGDWVRLRRDRWPWSRVGFWFVSHQFESLNLEELLQDVSDILGAWTYLLAGLLAFLETGAFVGLVVPGETFVILAGRGRRAGRDRHLHHDRDRLVLRLGRRHDQLLHRAAAGPGVHPPARAEGADHRGALRAGRGLLPRHGGKTILVGRFIGLVRALAPFVAGSSGMEYRAFVPLQRPRHGAVGGDVLAARLLRLAQHRPDRRARRARG